MVQVELVTGESDVTVNIFTVDGTAVGKEASVCKLRIMYNTEFV